MTADPQPFRDVHDLLDRLERDTNITLGQIADVLYRRWPEGVVLGVYEPTVAGPSLPGNFSLRGDHRTISYLTQQLGKVVDSLGQTTMLPNADGGPQG